MKVANHLLDGLARLDSFILIKDFIEVSIFSSLMDGI